MADAQALAAAIVAALGNAAAAGPPAGPYALAPALALHGPLDYTKKADAAIFQGAIKSLANKFDLDKPNIAILVKELKAKASVYGWEDLITIPTDGHDINLLTGYGRITNENVSDCLFFFPKFQISLSTDDFT